MREEKLQAYLTGFCTGRKHTVKSIQLEQLLGISGTDLRKLVNRLRKKGVPIGSSKAGYFYAENAGEVYVTIRQLQAMARGLEGAIHGLEKPLELFGPTGAGGDAR